MLYKYHNQFITLDEHHLLRAIDEEEKRHRNGTFKYRPLAISDPQIAQLKQTWPPDKLKEMAAKAKDISDSSKERRAYLALREFLTTVVAPTGTPASKYAAIDLAFSMLTNMAPGFRFDAKNNFVERIVQGKRYRLRPSERFAKMIVREELVKEADFYIFGLFSETVHQCWMLGWSSQEDMINGKRGNWNLDQNLNWPEMSYYKSVDELRPMSELVRQMGIEMVPDGVIFESVPTQSSIPLVSENIKEIEALMEQPTGQLTVITGLDDPKTDPVQPVQPVHRPTQSDPNADEYTF